VQKIAKAIGEGLLQENNDRMHSFKYYLTYQLVDKAYQTVKIIFDGKCKSALPFIFDWSPG
jgi:hypothetical protein